MIIFHRKVASLWALSVGHWCLRELLFLNELVTLFLPTRMRHECRYSVLSDPQRRRKYDIALLGEDSRSTGQHGDPTVSLWEAANRGDPDAMEAAYRRGGRVAWRNPGEDGRTAMHAASRGGHAQCIKLLVDLGADVKVNFIT